jgi:hypothetical protein
MQHVRHAGQVGHLSVKSFRMRHVFIDICILISYIVANQETREMHQVWRLNEAGPDNLGLACTDDGLLLGRTLLIERRGGHLLYGREVRSNVFLDEPL